MEERENPWACSLAINFALNALQLDPVGECLSCPCGDGKAWPDWQPVNQNLVIYRIIAGECE